MSDSNVKGDASTFRHRVYHEIERIPRTGQSMSWSNGFVAIVIVVSIITAILQTEPEVVRLAPTFFAYSDIVFIIIFGAEFIIRVWIAGEEPQFAGWRGRLRYIRSPVMLIDLAVLLSLIVLTSEQSVLCRMLRLVGILRLTRIAGMTVAIDALIDVVTKRRFELLLSVGVAIGLLIISASLLHVVEGHVQPDAFGSIPRAMWWSVATLTTVGYGDVYPITALGRVIAAISALLAVGVVALPAGVLAAAFSDTFQRRRARIDASMEDKTH